MKIMTADLLLASSVLYIRVKKAMLVLVALLLIGSGGLVSAQDILTLKSGKEIRANIIEEGADVIKYREFDNPAGPLYSISKENVASIKYKKENKAVPDINVRETEKPIADVPSIPGTSGLLTATKRNIYLDGNVQSPRSIKLLMEDHPEALKTYESGMKMFRRSNACPLAGMVLSFATAYSIKDMPEKSDRIRIGVIVLSIEGVLVISGILFAKTGKTKLQNSASLYNSAKNKPVSFKLDFGIQESGVGLALKF